MLKDSKKVNDTTKLQSLKGNNKLIGWLPNAKAQLDGIIGPRGIPISYLIRQHEIPPPSPGLLVNQAYSREGGSITDELISRATFNHPLMKEDNKRLFNLLHNAWKGTEANNAITPLMIENKLGREAWMAGLNEYASEDRYKAMVKFYEEKIQSLVYTREGSKNTLLKHAGIMRHAHAQLVLVNEQNSNISVTIPDDQARVRRLLNSIKCRDVHLVTRMEQVAADSGGKADNFDEAVSFLVEACPVYKRNLEGSFEQKPSSKNISISSVQIAGRGERTGVDLRWYPHDEYKKLTPEQKDEHRAWMRTPDGQKQWTKMKEAGVSSANGNQKSKTDRAKKRKQKKFDKAVIKEVNKRWKLETQVESIAASIADASIQEKETKDKKVSFANNAAGHRARVASTLKTAISGLIKDGHIDISNKDDSD